MRVASHPILSCAQAGEFEQILFQGDEAAEWRAMQRAGRGVAAAILRDFEEIGGFPAAGRVLVLVGKGHNGGDALIAAGAILERFPHAAADVVFAFGERSLRPLARRAWVEFQHRAAARVNVPSNRADEEENKLGRYALSLDGVFGFQFRPPLADRTAGLFRRVNALPVELRAAVDLPSGMDATDAFRADFTYATGSVKAPVLRCANAGRVRYLDLGFFEERGGGEGKVAEGRERVLTSEVLAPLGTWRSSQSDKRTYGHVFIVAGSRDFPGAGLMAVLSALRSGVGLVTAFVPESVAPAFAARAPEAMWVAWPETPTGGLALEGQHLLKERVARATALVIGPGLGREPETRALVREIVATSSVPLVIDADALQPEIVGAGTAARVLTPHAGEYARIAKDADVREFSNASGATVISKGSVSRICAGEDIYYSLAGGPVLARGGSGDLLAGLVGGLLAQTPTEPLLAACRGVCWHGRAADALARAHGQTAVMTTQLLDFLPTALRECRHEP